jgi:hypothetical protein
MVDFGQDSHGASHGLTTFTPAAANGAVSRVATVSPLADAVAAM